MDELGYKSGLREGINTLALYDKENCIVLGVYMTKPLRPETQALVDDCKAKYGDMVRFEHSDRITLLEGSLPKGQGGTIYYSDTSSLQSASLLLSLLPILLCFATLAFIVAWQQLCGRRKPLPAEGLSPLSLEQTKRLIKDRTEAPSARTDRLIQDITNAD